MSLGKIEHYLETGGWTRAVAGKDDFEAALLAIEQMCETGRGLIVSGEYGVGKTALAKIVAQAFGGAFTVRLAVPEDLRRFDVHWLELYAEDPYAQNAWLDDLGAESPVNEYGVKRDPAGDFIVQYHALHDENTRLIVTTNLNTSEVDQRYGGRVLSRLKDLCVPLRLQGPDKRRWAKASSLTDAASRRVYGEVRGESQKREV